MSEMTRREFGRSGLAGLAVFSGTPAGVTLQQSGTAYRYIHLDVFTDRRTHGTQLFLFTHPAGLDTDAMQALTRESNLSECTFVFPPEVAGTDHRVRIFTRTAETPFAGPAIINEMSATSLILPGQTVHADRWGNLIVETNQ